MTDKQSLGNGEEEVLDVEVFTLTDEEGNESDFELICFLVVK